MFKNWGIILATLLILQQNQNSFLISGVVAWYGKIPKIFPNPSYNLI